MAEERDDVEVAWARIVADYDREVDDAVGRWPAEEDLDDPTDDEPATSPVRWTDESSAERPGWGQAPDLVDDEADDRVDDRADDGVPAGTPPEVDDRWDPEHHYVPPAPPPLSRPDLTTGLAWAGVLGGPLTLLLATALAWDLPRLVTAACVIGFVGGIVFLVATMDDGRGRDGWDDGAQV